MANLFIGFPVPRAKIADMIEGAAPPLDHATQHEYGGDDAIDPTDQNSLVTLPFPLAGFFLDSYEVEGAGWQDADTGDGAMFLYSDHREMQTGSTNPSTYENRLHSSYPIPTLTWANKRHLLITILANHEDSATAIMRIITGHTDDNYFGFQIADGKLSAICGNAPGSQTVTDIKSYDPGAIDETLAFHAIFYPAVKVDFYVNGTLEATITTNLPTGTSNADYIIGFNLDNNSTTNNVNIRLNHFQLYQEP